MTSSDASANFRPPTELFPVRLEWRRSRWMMAGLCVLCVAAVAALWLSALSPVECGVGSVAAIAYAAWLLWRELRREPCALSWAGGDTDWQIECADRTESLRHVGASLRGGIAALTLADPQGRTRRYVWWPDTLDARGRRALRLAIASRRQPENPVDTARHRAQ